MQVGANLDLFCFREWFGLCNLTMESRCTMRVSLPFASNHICTSLFSLTRKERIWNTCVALQLE